MLKEMESLKGGLYRDIKKRMVKALIWSVTLSGDVLDVKGGRQTDRGS